MRIHINNKHLAKLQNAWQELWANAANRDVINMFIDLGTTILNLINDVGGLQSAFTLLYGGAIVKGLMTADSWLVKFIQGLDAAKASSQGLSDTLSKIYTNLIGNTGEDKGTRWKGLAQIQKDREQQVQQQPTTTTAVDTTSDAALIASKQAKANASREAAEANAEEVASEQALQAVNRGNAGAEAEETAAKVSGAAVSGQAAQENIKEAESAELAAQAIREKSKAEIEAAEASAVETMAQMSPKALTKFESKYNAAMLNMQKAGGKGVMDWSMSYVDGIDDIGEAAMNAGREVAQMGEIATNTATGFGAIGMSLAGLATNPMTWLIGIPAVIAVINGGLSLWRQHQQDLIDKAHETTASWNETKTSIDDFATKYTELSTQLQNQNLSEQERADIKKQVYELQKQITAEYGKQAEGINLINGNLDTQLAKLRSIKQEEARSNLRNNGKVYQEAVKQMTETQRQFQLNTIGTFSDEEFRQLTKDLAGHWSQFSNQYGEVGFNFTGTAEEADLAFDELYDRLGDMQQSMGKNWSGTIYESLTTAVENATAQNSKTLIKYKDDYMSYLEQSVFADTGTYGEDNLSAGEILTDLEEAVNNYNMALASGDTTQIDKAKESFDKLSAAAEQFYSMTGDERLTKPFKELEDSVDKVALEAYNVKKKFDDSNTKNIVESVLGSPKENKKAAKDIPDSLREAAENILDEQQKAYEWGMKPLGINPLQGLYGETQFGNINMDKRPIIKWNEEYRKRFAEALKSWNYMPKDGMVDTVFGGSSNFNGLEIAFTPILATKDGKLKDFMSYDAVHDYIQGLVKDATDKDGKIDAQLVLDLDADRKNIIGAIDGIGKYSAATVGKMMHFSGTKGSIYLGMEKLSKAAKDAGVDVNKVIEILRQTGNVDALTGVFDNFKYDVVDIEGYLSDLSNLPPEIANDILTLADAFGITADSSQESISAVAELLGTLGYIATNSMNEAGESFDKFALKASGWIEETSNLASTLSKGQGFLTFTKTQDDQGHEIASEVKAIADAYKDLEGYNFATLFEETAGGIMVNAEALRALQAEEESMRHAEFYEKRQELMEKFTASSGMAAEAYRKQIEELDMLWSAYSGATSALTKYQNNHGAADYSTNYKLFRDQIFKEGDAYLESGEIGEEGFRRISQLFSYKDLALASVDEVVEAYQTGADTMQKFFTENPTEGMGLWVDEVMSWPEEYAKITTNAAGETIMTMTDQNLDAVAKQYGVSKDLILSLMNEMNATGSRIHFFTDGQMQQLDAVTEKAEAARKKLVEIKDQGTDPALANSDILNFDIANMSADELKAKIEEIQALQADPDIDTETASLLNDLLQAAIDRLDLLNGKHVEPDIQMDTDGLLYAEEVASGLNERLEQINHFRKLGYEVSISGDEKVLEFSKELAAMPKEMQIALGFEPSTNPEDLAKQIEEKYSDGVKLKVVPEVEGPSAEDFNKAGTIGKAKVEVEADQQSIETAKQEAETGIAAAEPEIKGKVKMPDPDDYVWQGASIGEIHIPADIDDSEAKSTLKDIKKEAEQPMEGHLEIKADNTVQEAANQAGAQQGVETTKTETKITNEEVHSTATADTSQLDSAQQSIDRFKEANGSVIRIGVNVETQGVDTAEEKIAELEKKNNKIVNITIGAKTALFSKAYIDTINKLNTLAKKETIPEIKADNSNLKDKVSESKNKLDSIKGKSVNINANAIGFSYITSWKNSTYDQLHNKTITITTHYTSTGTKPKTGGGFNGTAHFNGTAVSHGHAFANGNWGLPEDEEGVLINEVAPELVVDAKTGQWQILNNGYPTFANLSRGSIIFNGNQTEEILKNGYIRGSYGRMMGGAFFTGTATTDWNGDIFGDSFAAGGTIRRPKTYTRSGSSGSSNKSSGKSSGSSGRSKGKSGKSSNNSSSNKSNKSAKDFSQTLDAIEIQLNRIDAEISRLDTNAAKTYDTFSNRSKALKDDLSTVTKEITRVNNTLKSTSFSYNYLAKAAEAAKKAGLKDGDEGYKKGSENAVGTALSQKWIDKIKNSIQTGKYMTINDVGNEGLWKKIQAYQTWYEKHVKLQQKRQEYVNKLSQLTIQQLQLIQSNWETILNKVSADTTEFQARNDLLIEKGYDASEKYYRQQINKNKTRRADLIKEANQLEAQLNAAVKAGRIKKGSEEWYKWQTTIKNIRNEIINTDKEIANLNNSIRQLKWDAFDRAQNRIGSMADEAEFLLGLINEIDLFDKKGRITDKGLAGLGFEAQRYDLYVKQAKKYGDYVKQLNKQLATDPNNQKLIEQRDSWKKAQQDAIENAHSEKEAIADLIEKGIKKQIEAMEELIDKYEEAMDAERDQQRYADSIAEKQKKINSLQKQLRSMEGDDSEEGATRRQKLRDQLSEAQKDLQEAQEDKRIDDIKESLSNMQERYEDVLNARLDNIDALLTEVISQVNQSGADIVATFKQVANSVGYQISAELERTYQGVKNLTEAQANTSGVSGALVSDTNNRTGSTINTSATTVQSSPNPTVQAYKRNGWANENGQKVYYKNDTKVTGLQTINGKKYYFDKSGNMQTGTRTIGNKQYYFDTKTGEAKTSAWVTDKTGKRYYGADSTMMTGMQKIGNNYYDLNTKTGYLNTSTNGIKGNYLFQNGVSVTKAYTDKSGTRYFDSAQGLLKGFQQINGKYHLLNPNTGVEQKIKDGLNALGNDWYWFEKGKLKTSAWYPSAANKQMYFLKSGKAAKGLQKIGDTTYLFGNDAKLNTTRQLYKGEYLFDKGMLLTGWQNMKDGTHYFSTNTGKMLTGYQKIGNNEYVFNDQGVLKKGAFEAEINGEAYDVTTDNDGKIKTKKKKYYKLVGTKATNNNTTIPIKKGNIGNIQTIGAKATGSSGIMRPGMYRVDEQGREVFINKNGKIYTRLDKGTAVLPHDAAMNLLKGMSNPSEFIKEHMDLAPKNISTTNNKTGNTVNNITFNLPNVTDYKEFMREAQRDPNFTKYIQEISIGKLNGNNSLRGNAIQFR